MRYSLGMKANGSLEVCPFYTRTMPISETPITTFSGPNAEERAKEYIANHTSEVDELKNGKAGQPPHQPVEAADCAILLLAHAARASYSLHQAILERFAVLQTRTWGEPDADGVIEHVREADP